MTIKYTLVYGTAHHTPDLLEAARMAALKAFSLVVSNWGMLVLDRYGIEAEVMKTCSAFKIPLLVIGTNARPRSGVSMKHYERAILPLQAHQDKEAQVMRYAVNKASGMIILGDSADCHALRVYARLVHKQARQAVELSPVVPVAPDTDWLRQYGHYYVSKV